MRITVLGGVFRLAANVRLHTEPGVGKSTAHGLRSAKDLWKEARRLEKDVGSYHKHSEKHS